MKNKIIINSLDELIINLTNIIKIDNSDTTKNIVLEIINFDIEKYKSFDSLIRKLKNNDLNILIKSNVSIENSIDNTKLLINVLLRQFINLPENINKSKEEMNITNNSFREKFISHIINPTIFEQNISSKVYDQKTINNLKQTLSELSFSLESKSTNRYLLLNTLINNKIPIDEIFYHILKGKDNASMRLLTLFFRDNKVEKYIKDNSNLNMQVSVDIALDAMFSKFLDGVNNANFSTDSDFKYEIESFLEIFDSINTTINQKYQDNLFNYRMKKVLEKKDFHDVDAANLYDTISKMSLKILKDRNPNSFKIIKSIEPIPIFTKLYKTLLSSDYDLYKTIKTNKYFNNGFLFDGLATREFNINENDTKNILHLINTYPTLTKYFKNNIFLVDFVIRNNINSPILSKENLFLEDFMINNLKLLNQISSETKKILLLNTITTKLSKELVTYTDPNESLVPKLIAEFIKSFPDKENIKLLEDNINSIKNLKDEKKLNVSDEEIQAKNLYVKNFIDLYSNIKIINENKLNINNKHEELKINLENLYF